ncbi:MAG: erythromycin esterase family protein [Candidatus Nitrosocosmicus sp.]
MLSKPKDLDLLLERVGDSQYVLLGESTHGTSEFYRWRSEISKRLILEKGFSFIAVEGDWPDCFEVNKYIKGFLKSGNKSAFDVLHSFNRWPTWMWANKEMVETVEWLKEYNDTIINQQKLSTTIDKTVGFYGLDLYSLWESMEAILEYLRKTDPSLLNNAIEAYNCFEPYNKDVEAYARATAFVPENCEEKVIEILAALHDKYKTNNKTDDLNKEEYLNAEQNAIVTKDAERYYRIMMKGDVNSWNLRDTHMMNTLEHLMDFHNQGKDGKISKAIVWAHNTHIGDARFTDMAKEGMINIGQLVRQKKGTDNTVLVGFSTYSGTVIAAKQWGASMEIMDVPPAKKGSWDNLLHGLNNNIHNDKIIFFEKDTMVNSTNDSAFTKKMRTETIDDENYDSNSNSSSRGQRAIGVVYNPNYERFGNYVPTILSKRYDSLIFIDNTNALSPLHLHPIKNKDLPETFPTGV